MNARVAFSTVALVALTACATHRDALYSFSISGQVLCTGRCRDPGAVELRVIDSGLDYRRAQQRFVIARRDVPVGDPFAFEVDYFWGRTSLPGRRTDSGRIVLEAVAPGCRSVPQEIDLDTVPHQDGRFLLEGQQMQLECSGRD